MSSPITRNVWHQNTSVGQSNNVPANTSLYGEATVVNLNAFSVASGASITYKASNQINIAPGFHAMYGSTARLYIDNIYLDCSNLSTSTYGKSRDTSGADPGVTATSLINSTQNNQIKITPNPSSGQINITHDLENENVTVQLLDGQGRMVVEREVRLQQSPYTLQSDLANGVYHLTIIDSKGQRLKSEKIIVVSE
jgi:hypothetical protein